MQKVMPYGQKFFGKNLNLTINKMENYQNILSAQKVFYNSQLTKNVKFRISQLNKLYTIVQTNEAQILEALYNDFKKPAFEGYATEIGLVLNEIKYHIKNLKKWSSPTRKRGNLLDFYSSAKIISEPYGQVLIIAPWNYPFQLAFTPLVGAISAGNTAIIKPSEIAPSTSKIIFKILNGAFPENYIYCAEGGQIVAEELLTLKFNFIFFTGSEQVGRNVMKAAASNLIPVCLELGGKSPCIIDKTANIDLSCKRIVWGKFLNAGQTCVAPDYILVDKHISGEVKKGLKKYIQEFYGTAPHNSKDFARIINEKHFRRISELITPEKIYCGGEVNEKERYIAPTILENIDFNHKIMQEEIFGPVLPIIEYSDPKEFIEILKNGNAPLSLYVFSKNEKFINKMLSEIEAGNANINDTVMQFANKNIPFGGKGNSGIGAYHGKHSFDCFSHFKAVNIKTSLFDLPFRYPPYSSSKYNLIHKLLK